jgi:DNA (cytosine-5)-methyltransferase 1
VFVVGCLGDWRAAAEVLFESDCLRGDIKKGRKEGQDAAAFTASSFGNYGEGVGTIRATGGDLGGGSETLYVPDTARCLTRGVAQKNDYETDTFVTKVYENHAQDSRVNEVEVSPTVAAKWGTGGGNVPLVQNVAFGWQNSASQSMSVDTISPTLDKSKTPAVAVGVDVYNHSETGQLAATFGRNSGGTNTAGPKVMVQQPIPEYYAHQYCQDRVYSTEGITPALNCSQAHKFRFDMAVRRLTPIECERLQGFPDDYTNIKDKCPDGPRYKAMGNSMAVPVMRWIGERINKVNSLL